MVSLKAKSKRPPTPAINVFDQYPPAEPVAVYQLKLEDDGADRKSVV